MSALDTALLSKELDWCMSRVFMGANSAFLGSIMSSHNFIWAEDIPTAQTNGVSLQWNPHWFLKLPRPTRCTVLKHELWHPARLHFLRRGNRDPLFWNWACDIRINNDLDADGDSFQGWSPWIKRDLRDMAEEDIYDYLVNLRDNQGLDKITIIGLIGGGSWAGGDMSPELMNMGDMTEDMTEDQIRNQVNNVIMADQIAQQQGEAGLGQGRERLILNQWLTPAVPWEKELTYWMQDLMHSGHTWKRPNRRHRHSDLYLPSKFLDDGRLSHLMYFLDVSGSISESDIVRFNSEVYFIKKTYNPKRLTLVQFDDGITNVIEINEEDDFEEVEVIGRGGTSWGPVKAYIEEHRPTAAIVFTDMGFGDPITPLNVEVPLLWVALNAGRQRAPFGRITHIRN
jgi:predicted metal-dependent peptidase